MTNPDSEALQRGVHWLSIAFIFLGLMAGLSTFLQTYMLNLAGSHLTLRLREQVFDATLKQEIGWFDQRENSVGALGARLSGDCSSVQGVSSLISLISVFEECLSNQILFYRQLAAVSAQCCSHSQRLR